MTEKQPLMLLSKLVAGGLSAGVVLVWWPALSHSSGAGSWILRGVLWTCLFELLLLVLYPLEEALLRSRVLRRATQSVSPWKPSSSRGAVILGLGTILLCSLLVVQGPEQPRAKPRTNVRVERIVQKVQPIQIIRKTVVVQEQSPQRIQANPLSAEPNPKPSSSPKKSIKNKGSKPGHAKKTQPKKNINKPSPESAKPPVRPPTSDPKTPTEPGKQLRVGSSSAFLGHA